MCSSSEKCSKTKPFKCFQIYVYAHAHVSDLVNVNIHIYIYEYICASVYVCVWLCVILRIENIERLF